ncbi:PfkB family carbohydrate kinase [Jiella sonneratiae]|uniref:Sugar kinase n=1 Tax=Jiella sonneratiae TaxID=2816856 RepID=A0ABS3J4W4_9HYPH|nr:PfkB family carbohydrate kinase [Jiella sonneratiae]MBO0904719.1 sugar kinase [Jiella sonneratiae]
MTGLAPAFGERPSTVICLGLSAFDYIWQVERLPEGRSDKVRAPEFMTKGGGMAATAAVAVARLGGKAHFWGRAGEDREGAAMRDELAAEGVDVSGFRLFAGGRSSISGVFVDPAGERHIANFRGEKLPAAPDFLPLAEIAAAGAVLADPRWPEGAEAAFAAAREAGVPTVLDADVADRAVFEMLLPLTDHAVFSAPALAGFAGRDAEAALAEVAGYGCRIAAATLGGDGVLWREAGATARRPAFAVPVVDTTGAGDVFHGAYALAVAQGAATGDAIGFASAAAALKCTAPGGRRGIPTFDQTIKFWRDNS